MSKNAQSHWNDLLKTTLVKELGGKASQIQVDLVILQRPKMQGLNNQYRHKDTPTDVLSFPLYSHADLQHELNNPDTQYPIPNTLLLGTLVICPAVVRARATEEGLTYDQRATWTVQHGVKHLLGYDHDDTGETWFPSRR